MVSQIKHFIGGKLVRRHQSAGDDLRLHRAFPALVVGGAEREVRRQMLARVARHVDVPGAGCAHGAVARWPLG